MSQVGEEQEEIALIALKIITDLLSPSYILDQEGRERLNILQSYFLSHVHSQINRGLSNPVSF